MAIFKSMLRTQSFKSWTNSLSNELELPSFLEFVRQAKKSDLVMSGLWIHSTDESENELTKEFLGHIVGWARVLRQKTKTHEEHQDDEKIIFQLMPALIEDRLSEST